jgi:hypothetical protein
MWAGDSYRVVESRANLARSCSGPIAGCPERCGCAPRMGPPTRDATRPGSAGRNRRPHDGVEGGMPNFRLPLTVLSVAVFAAACGSAGSASPPASNPPSAPPTTGGVDHPTGATDVVLQFEEGGGFVPIEFLAGQAPIFTLFGDGRVVFQPAVTTFPEPGPDGVIRNTAWRTAQLDAAQIEELLTFALGQGGLGAARDNYGNDMVADASTAFFKIKAGGLDKTVSVYALGMEDPNATDLVPRRAFKALADRLRDFDRGGSISTDVYLPDNFRAVLVEREGDPLAKPTLWPWPDLTMSDFKANVNGVGATQFPHRTITAVEVQALGLGDVAGGAQGVTLTGPDGKLYTLILRPLLPHETE